VSEPAQPEATNDGPACRAARAGAPHSSQLALAISKASSMPETAALTGAACQLGRSERACATRGYKRWTRMPRSPRRGVALIAARFGHFESELMPETAALPGVACQLGRSERACATRGYKRWTRKPRSPRRGAALIAARLGLFESELDARDGGACSGSVESLVSGMSGITSTDARIPAHGGSPRSPCQLGIIGLTSEPASTTPQGAATSLRVPVPAQVHSSN
jgi:hypothetical protein